METLQTPTTDSQTANKGGRPVGMTPVAIHGDSYIDYCAIQGLVTTEDGEVKRMTATEFAHAIDVNRTTLYEWQKIIPNFWDKVQERRKQIGGQARIMKVYNGLYLKAAAGNPQAASLWLANHDPNFRMPAQKVEHEVGAGLADLMKRVRDAQPEQPQQPEVIEGEVVDGDQPNNA